MKELTRDHLKAIIEAIGAQFQGEALCLADWGRVLEHAAAEGFDVSGNLARINAQLPEGLTPLELVPLERQQEIYDTLDQNIPGGNRRIWLEHQRRLVNAALAKIESPNPT